LASIPRKRRPATGLQLHKPIIYCGLVFLTLAINFPLFAQRADRLSEVKTVYIDSLGQSKRAADIREHLVRRLEHSSEIKVTSDMAKADALIKGTGQIWTVGEITLSPHSHSANETMLEGYLSVEVVGKGNQTLWSYLATPSKFPWGGLADDLAKQTVSRLLDDVKAKAQPQTAEPGKTVGATLHGAGATFPAPLYRKWIQSFEELHPDAHVSYDPVGSGQGILRVSAGQVEFGASEMPIPDEVLAKATRRLIQIPMVLGAVVPIYNVPGLRHRINFTPGILADIFLGKIKKWSAPEIRAVNREESLPDSDIVVVHRSDSSGTSFVWSDYLSKVSAEWKSSVGSGVTVRWPVGVGAAYNDGVAAAVQNTPNSIGYVELIYAIQHELSIAPVRNSAGQFVKADLSSVTEAARASSGVGSSFRPSITDPPRKSAYPIATYTWLLLPLPEDRNKREALLELVRWMLSSGQKSCSALGYAPLPADVAANALQSAERFLKD
jgi:phosphate transport system substrate-binding protein